jgi:hypothetical protein
MWAFGITWRLSFVVGHPAMFRLIWPSGFRGGDFLKIGQLETRIACGVPCLVMDYNKMCTL